MERGTKNEMSTLVSCMDHLRTKGFTENFTVDEQGIKIQDIKKHYKPAQISIENYYRFEGETDPADSAILYAIETNDGLRGVLSDAHGLYADRLTAAFMNRVEDMNKVEHFSSRKGLVKPAPPIFG